MQEVQEVQEVQEMLLDKLAHVVSSSTHIGFEDRANAGRLLDCVITCVGHRDIWPWHSRDHKLLLTNFGEVTGALHWAAGLTDTDVDFEKARHTIRAALAALEVHVVCVKRLKRTLVPASLAGTTRPRDEGILNDRDCPAPHRIHRRTP